MESLRINSSNFCVINKDEVGCIAVQVKHYMASLTFV